MIHIDLSVPSHNRDSPPQIFLKKKFETWAQAREWVQSMGFRTGSSMDWFYHNPNNEYVGVEVELQEIGGTEWTNVVMSVEGNEDRFDPDDPRDHLKTIRQWAEARTTNPLGDPAPVIRHHRAIWACQSLERYLTERPNDEAEPRMVHIYG